MLYALFVGLRVITSRLKTEVRQEVIPVNNRSSVYQNLKTTHDVQHLKSVTGIDKKYQRGNTHNRKCYRK